MKKASETLGDFFVFGDYAVKALGAVGLLYFAFKKEKNND